MADDFDAVVIGAGAAGLAAAYGLASRRARVCVLEGSDHVGGLARSFELWGVPVDLGSHILGQPRGAVAELWDDVGVPSHRVALRRGVLSGGTAFAYPLRPAAIARDLGVRGTVRAALQLGSARFARRGLPSESAKAWMCRRYGTTLYNRFFESYIEKRWGIPGDEIDASFASELLGTSSSEDARAATFIYPSDGLGAFTAALAATVRARGGEIRTGAKVVSVDVVGGAIRGVGSAGGDLVTRRLIAATGLGVAALVSSFPADALAALGSLRRRAIVLVYLHLDGTEGFAELWRYMYDRDVAVGRVANVRRWWAAGGERASRWRGRTILCAEYWCNPGDDLFTSSDATLIARATTELDAKGLLAGGRTVDGRVIKLSGGPLVPTIGYRATLERVLAPLTAIRGLNVVHRGDGTPAQDVIGSLASGIGATDPNF